MQDQTHVITTAASEFPWNVYPTAAAATQALATLQAERPDEFAAGEVLHWQTWNDRHEKNYLDKPEEWISEERWHEMLGVLPPLDWRREGGLERFTLSEFTSGRITQQFAHRNGCFAVKYVRMNDRATYWTAQEFDDRLYAHIETSLGEIDAAARARTAASTLS